MKKSLPILIILIICGCIGFTGCTVSSAEEMIVTQDYIVATKIQSTATSTSLTLTLPSARQSTPVATLSPAPTTTNSTDIIPKTCTVPPKRYNARQELNINKISFLEFDNENLLTFEGWTQRPEPIVTPITPEPTPDMFPGPNNSARILLVGGQLHLEDGEFDSFPLEVAPPLGNPCGEACPMEVVSQSPDGQWQLIQVSDWLSEKEGFWLVGKEEMLRLIPYVTNSKWRWSSDSSLLWIVTSHPNDIGGYTQLVQLDPSVSIKETERGSLLDPFLYFLAFSPLDKTIVSIPSYEQGLSRSEELYQVNATESITQGKKIRDVPGIIRASWNMPTQSFLVEVVKERRVEYQDLFGNPIVTIPFNTLEAVIPSLADENRTLDYGLSNNFTLSKSGRYLAIIHTPGEIWVFNCE